MSDIRVKSNDKGIITALHVNGRLFIPAPHIAILSDILNEVVNKSIYIDDSKGVIEVKAPSCDDWASQIIDELLPDDEGKYFNKITGHRDLSTDHLKDDFSDGRG